MSVPQEEDKEAAILDHNSKDYSITSDTNMIGVQPIFQSGRDA